MFNLLNGFNHLDLSLVWFEHKVVSKENLGQHVEKVLGDQNVKMQVLAALHLHGESP